MLHAACAELSQRGEAVGYVPLDKRTWFVPEVLEGMEQLSLVCIDNIECVAGDDLWEMAIFNLYNRILESGQTRILITCERKPRKITWHHVLIGGRFTVYNRCLMMTNCRLCSYVPGCVVLNCQRTWAVFCSNASTVKCARCIPRSISSIALPLPPRAS